MSLDISIHVKQVNEAAHFLRKFFSKRPHIAIQLGTGLGSLADRIDIVQSISYKDIPHFPQSTVESHQGRLIIGRIGNQQIVALSGRFHYYEGYSTLQVSFAIRVLQLLGINTLIITNAAGGLNPLFLPGSIMIIRDHLNYLGENPLRGPNIDEWGPRFPDLSEPYHPSLIRAALRSADRCGLKQVVTGVYVCVPGPSLETPAETRWIRQCGADAVGMSTVPEVIVAKHAGMQVLGLSVIANVNDPDNFQPISLADVIATAEKAGPELGGLVIDIITNNTTDS